MMPWVVFFAGVAIEAWSNQAFLFSLSSIILVCNSHVHLSREQLIDAPTEGVSGRWLHEWIGDRGCAMHGAHARESIG